MKKIFFGLLLIFFVINGVAFAQTAAPIGTTIDFGSALSPQQLSNSMQLLLSISLITLVPFFLISTTAFLRIVIVLSMIRTAIGTQQTPPNSVIIGFALFMTLFVMTPVFQDINSSAIVPYNQKKISQTKAFELGMIPLRKFMFRQTREADLRLFIQFSKIKPPTKFEEVPTYVLIPAYMISELKTAFQIGFLIFIPFIVIDLVVANILLSLGMFMLSPVMVSLPFKILLFVLADGWNLICRGLLTSFR